MRYNIYKSTNRGHYENEWLNTFYSFSFSEWFDRKRMNFGALRVFNDDTINPNSGFGMHPHNDMEIITIILEGSLKHKDSMGNEGIISEGEIQTMSAGSGIFHSEFNPSTDKTTKLFQIWIYPYKKGLSPEYNQVKYDVDTFDNKITTLVGPKSENFPLSINQNAYLSLAVLDEQNSIKYDLKRTGNGIFIMNIDGKFDIDGKILENRDSIEISETNELEIKAVNPSKLLLIEVPMERKYE